MALKIDGSPGKFTATQVSVGPTAVQLVAARQSRSKLILANNSVWVGGDSSVTSDTGFFLGNYPAPAQLDTAAEVWAIRRPTDSAIAMAVIELYDEEA